MILKLITIGIQLVISILNLISSKQKAVDLKAKVFDRVVKSKKGEEILQASASLKMEHEGVRKEILKRKMDGEVA